MPTKTVRVASRMLNSRSDAHQRAMLDAVKSDFPAFQVSPVSSPKLHAVPFECCQDYDAAYPEASRYLTRNISTVLVHLLCDYTPRGYRRNENRHALDDMHTLTATKTGVKHLRGTFAALLFVPTDASLHQQNGHAVDLLTFQPASRIDLHKEEAGVLVWRTHRHIASAHAQSTVPDHAWAFHTDWTAATLDKRLDALLQLTADHELRPVPTRGYLLPEAMPKRRIGYYELALHAAKCAANQWLAMRRGEVWETTLTLTTDTPSAYTERRTYVYARSASPNGHYDLSTEWQLAALSRVLWEFDAEMYSLFMQTCMNRLQVGEQFSHTHTRDVTTL